MSAEGVKPPDLGALAMNVRNAASERQRPPAAELPATEAVAQPEISEADVREALEYYTGGLGRIAGKGNIDIGAGDVMTQDALDRIVERTEGQDAVIVRIARRSYELLTQYRAGDRSADQDTIRNAMLAAETVMSQLDEINSRLPVVSATETEEDAGTQPSGSNEQGASLEAQVRAAIDRLREKMYALARALAFRPPPLAVFGDNSQTGWNTAEGQEWMGQLVADVRARGVALEAFEHLPDAMWHFSQYLKPIERARHQTEEVNYEDWLRYSDNVSRDIDAAIAAVSTPKAPDTGPGTRGMENGVEDFKSSASSARFTIALSFVGLAQKLGLVLPAPVGNDNFDNRSIQTMLSVITAYLRETDPENPERDTVLFSATFDIDNLSDLIRGNNPMSNDYIQRIIETATVTAGNVDRVANSIDPNTVNKERVRELFQNITAIAEYSARQEGRTAAGAERGPVRPESPEMRERTVLRRELSQQDPLSGERIFESPIFDAYLMQALTHYGLSDQLDMLIERINAILQDRMLQAPRDAGIINPPHPLTENEYRGYIRNAASETQRYMRLERQKTGTVMFDSGDVLTYTQTLDGDGTPKVTIQVPRDMRQNANEDEPSTQDAEFPGVSLSEAVLALIEQVGLTGQDGKPCTYSRAVPNPLRKERVPLTSWIMSFVPGTPVWRSNRRTRKEQAGRRKALQSERAAARLKVYREGRAFRDMGKEVSLELWELLKRGTLTEDEVSDYYALHDEVSTYLRRPFVDMTPRQKEIDGKVQRALENLRVDKEKERRQREDAEVRPRLIEAGIHRLREQDSDAFGIIEAELNSGRPEITIEDVNDFYAWKGAEMQAKTLSSYFRFSSKDKPHTVNVIEAFVARKKSERRDAEQAKLAGRGREMLRDGNADEKAEYDLIERAVEANRLLPRDAEAFYRAYAGMGDAINSTERVRLSRGLGILSGDDEGSISRVQNILSPLRAERQGNPYERGLRHLRSSDPGRLARLDESVNNGFLSEEGRRAAISAYAQRQ